MEQGLEQVGPPKRHRRRRMDRPTLRSTAGTRQRALVCSAVSGLQPWNAECTLQPEASTPFFPLGASKSPGKNPHLSHLATCGLPSRLCSTRLAPLVSRSPSPPREQLVDSTLLDRPDHHHHPQTKPDTRSTRSKHRRFVCIPRLATTWLPLCLPPTLALSTPTPIPTPTPPTMSDKKNEDYAIRMPDSATRSSPAYGGEKDAFLGRPSRGGSSSGGFQQSLSNVENNGPVSILAYCLASISMTIVNKYVVSGHEWNMTFLYLAVQVRRIPLPPSPADGLLSEPRASRYTNPQLVL